MLIGFITVVNNVLLPHQRNTDKERTTDSSGEAKTSPQQMTDNEEGTPFFTKYAHLVPTANPRLLSPRKMNGAHLMKMSIKKLTQRNSY